MSAYRVRELCREGKLKEAYTMAIVEYNVSPDNIYNKRSLGWVYYAYCKQAAEEVEVATFVTNVKGVKHLKLPPTDLMIPNALLWCYVKFFRNLHLQERPNYDDAYKVFESLKDLCFTIPSQAFSALVEQLHKVYKYTPLYIQMIDICLPWLRSEDFIPRIFNGKTTMPLAEQLYIGYAKHILLGEASINETWGYIQYTPNKQLAQNFLPTLNYWIEEHPSYTLLPYFKAKIELFLEEEKALEHFLPFARKQPEESWVWQLLSEMTTDESLAFSCLCKALSVAKNEKFLTQTRLRLAQLLLNKGLFSQARTKIEMIVRVKEAYGQKIPDKIMQWQTEYWYMLATPLKNNFPLYAWYKGKAESILD